MNALSSPRRPVRLPAPLLMVALLAGLVECLALARSALVDWRRRR